VPEFSYGLLNNNDLTGMPDGLFAQLWYLSKYILPGVVISAIAYYATSFGLRYRVRAGDEVLYNDLNNKPADRKKRLTIAGIAVGGGLLAIIGGSIAGIVAIVLVIGGVVFAGISIFAKHGTVKEVWVNRNTGQKQIVDAANPMAIGVALAIFAGAILAMYFLSGLVIALFNVIFIYMAVKNYVMERR
jgi:hypothetical protein